MYIHPPEVMRAGGRLPGGCPPAPPSPSFLRELRRRDDGVELVWGYERWHLYRRKGPRLLHEFTLAGPEGQYRPVGDWLFAEMRKRELAARYGTQSHERAIQLMLQGYDRATAAKEEAEEKRIEDLAATMVDEVIEPATREPMSVMVNKG